MTDMFRDSVSTAIESGIDPVRQISVHPVPGGNRQIYSGITECMTDRVVRHHYISVSQIRLLGTKRTPCGWLVWPLDYCQYPGDGPSTGFIFVLREFRLALMLIPIVSEIGVMPDAAANYV